MHDTELLILGLCVVIPTLSVIARVLDIPYPIVLVLGVIPLGFIPGVPEVELEPDVVLVLFLPPLLYVAAFFADLRALQAHARAITLTSIGLVLLTTCAVAVVGHEVVGPALGGRLRARRHRLADRPGGGDGDRAGAGGSTQSDHRARGREPGQRLLGADRLPSRRRGGDRRQLFSTRCQPGVRRRGRWWDRDRPSSRRRDHRDSAASRRHPRRDHDLDLQRLRRLPPRGGARRVGRARRGYHGYLPRLDGAPDLDRPDEDPGLCRLGADRVHPERAPVRADRAAAARASWTPSRGSTQRAWPATRWR